MRIHLLAAFIIGSVCCHAQDHVGINVDTPQFNLDIRTFSPDLGGNLQLGNQSANHFMRLFPGHDQDPKPFLLFSKEDTFRVATSGQDFSDFTERLTIQPDGDVGIGIVQPINRLHVHDPDIYTVGQPPLQLMFGDENYLQLTNGVSGRDTTSGLLLGVNAGGMGSIKHPLLVRIESDKAKVDVLNSNATVLIDSSLIVSKDLRVLELGGSGNRALIADEFGNVMADEIDNNYAHYKGFENDAIWIVPSGVDRVQVELWGGGGGGEEGGGGGAGGYLKGQIDVTSGDSIMLRVGQGATAAGLNGSDTDLRLNGNILFAVSGGRGAIGDRPGGGGFGFIYDPNAEAMWIQGASGKQNTMTFGAKSATEYVKVIAFGAGGCAFNRPGTGGSGATAVIDASTGTLLERDNATMGARPGGGGGGNLFPQGVWSKGGWGHAIIYW